MIAPSHSDSRETLKTNPLRRKNPTWTLAEPETQKDLTMTNLQRRDFWGEPNIKPIYPQSPKIRLSAAQATSEPRREANSSRDDTRSKRPRANKSGRNPTANPQAYRHGTQRDDEQQTTKRKGEGGALWRRHALSRAAGRRGLSSFLIGGRERAEREDRGERNLFNRCFFY